MCKCKFIIHINPLRSPSDNSSVAKPECCIYHLTGNTFNFLTLISTPHRLHFLAGVSFTSLQICPLIIALIYLGLKINLVMFSFDNGAKSGTRGVFMTTIWIKKNVCVGSLEVFQKDNLIMRSCDFPPSYFQLPCIGYTGCKVLLTKQLSNYEDGTTFSMAV